MPRKTALADEIAALLNPTPAEQDDDEFVSSSQKSLGLLGDEDVAVQEQSGQRRMRAAIDMSSTGAKYAGRVTTRDALDRRHRLPSKPQRAEEEEDDEDDEDDDEDNEDAEEMDSGEEGEEGEESEEEG